MNQDDIKSYLDRADEIVSAASAFLGPYAAPFSMALGIVAKVEPAVYASILKWMEKGEPTDEEKAQLMEIVNRLRNPDDYFK